MLHTPGVSDDRQANPLVETKLHIPSPRRNLVARPRLQARLAGAADAKLILVSAPAGFGKTTLVTAWLGTVADDGAAVAWLSLDERDNDPASFWSYVLAALESAVPGLGANARALLGFGGHATGRRAGDARQRAARRRPGCLRSSSTTSMSSITTTFRTG